MVSLESEKLLSTFQAGKILGVQANTLKQSRHTGILFGKEAPRYLKMGRSIRYKLSSLLEFRRQFFEYKNTSEYRKNDIKEASVFHRDGPLTSETQKLHK